MALVGGVSQILEDILGLEEGVLDREAFDLLAMLHVFGVEDIATGFDGGRQDEGVVDLIAIAVSNRYRSLVCGQGQRDWGLAQQANVKEFATNLRPGPLELAPSDRRELIQDLNAETTAHGQKLECRFRARIALGDCIKQDVGIKEWFGGS